MSLCSPALLYFIIGIMAIVSMVYSKTDMQTVAMKGLFIAIWTWFLNFLCSKGHEGISWFLVILPFVIMALVIVAMSNIIGGKIAQNKEMFSNNPDCSTDPDNTRGCPEYCKTNLNDRECWYYCIDNSSSQECEDFCKKHPYNYVCKI